MEAFGWAGGRDARQSLKDRATLGSVFRGTEAGYPFDSRIQRSGREERLRCCDSEGAETEGAAHRTDELAEAQGGRDWHGSCSDRARIDSSLWRTLLPLGRAAH